MRAMLRVTFSDYWGKHALPRSRQMRKKSSALGEGMSAWIGDMVPFTPSSTRRAGAAALMAQRMHEDPGVLLKMPLLAQAGAAAAGGLAAYAAYDQPKLTRVAAALAPLAMVQVMKRKRMRDIDERYRGRKRHTRLRDLNLDDVIARAVGSRRLGMIQALDGMQNRRRNLGSVAEAADAIPAAGFMAGGGLGGMALTTPITEMIDQWEGNRMLRKKAGLDQTSGPVLPLFLASALMAGGGQLAAALNASAALRNGKPSERSEWERLVQSTSGTRPVTISSPGFGNAAFMRGTTPAEIDQLTDMAIADPHNVPGDGGLRLPSRLGFLQKLSPATDARTELRRRVSADGAVVADPELAHRSILAHEGGHAAIDATPGVLRFLQNKVYPHADKIAPFSGVASMAAGLAAGSPLKGALAGTGIGAVTGVGTLAPELMASWKGLRSLEAQGLSDPGDRRKLVSALATYAAGAVLPSTFAGMAGGWLSKRRRKQPMKKEAGVTPEAAQALLHRLDLYRQMGTIARDLGHNAAVRFGEANRLAHGGRPASAWRNALGNKVLLELAGGIKPKNLESARSLLHKAMATTPTNFPA